MKQQRVNWTSWPNRCGGYRVRLWQLLVTNVPFTCFCFYCCFCFCFCCLRSCDSGLLKAAVDSVTCLARPVRADRGAGQLHVDANLPSMNRSSECLFFSPHGNQLFVSTWHATQFCQTPFATEPLPHHLSFYFIFFFFFLFFFFFSFVK